jgi:A118 family predicted phage portal protein
MKPNRVWRNNPHAVHLGRSDFAGVEPLMDALDLTQSSWIRDVDLGKSRIVVPRYYLQSNGPGQGASIDLDQEVYEGINAQPSEGGGTEIHQVQFKIRVEEHSATIKDLKTTIVGAAGYSAQTFGLDTEGGAATATEVNAKHRRSLITRDRKTRYWRPELADITEVLLQVDVAQFGTKIVPQRPIVQFADAVSVDPLARAQELQALHAAEAISTEEKVRTRRPDWDDTAVAEEVEKILREFGKLVEDPDTFTGGPPGGEDQAETDDAGDEPEPPA